MKKYISRKLVLKYLIVLLFANSFAIAVQFYKGAFLDSAVYNAGTSTLWIGLILFGLISFEIGFTCFSFVSENGIISNSLKSIKSRLFDKILSLKFNVFETPSKYVAKYTNELSVLEGRYYRSATLLMEFVLKVLFVSIALFWLNWKLALITMVLVTMPLYVPKIAEKKLKKRQDEYLSRNNRFLAFITDMFNGFEVVKNFNIENMVRKNFNRNNKSAMDGYLLNLNTQSQVRTISMFMSYFTYFIVVAFSIYLLTIGKFTVGDLLIAIGLVEQLSYPIIATAGCIQNIVSTKNLNMEFSSYLESVDNIETSKYSVLNTSIDIQNLSFAYDESELLKNVNMTFEKGKKYVLKGESGAGKTTLLNILMKYNDSYEGSVYIDNTNLREVENIYDHVSISRQDNIIFEDTLKNNLTLFKEITDEQVIDTLKLVKLDKYANSQSLGLVLGSEGLRLSGGEKKRLTLARTMLHRRSVLILDEPLANLDKKMAKEIENMILNIGDVTLIMVSHQISDAYLEKFDKVYVI